MEGMLVQLLEPLISDENACLLVVFIAKLKPLFVSILNDIFEVLSFESPKHTEKELSLWQPVR